MNLDICEGPKGQIGIKESRSGVIIGGNLVSMIFMENGKRIRTEWPWSESNISVCGKWKKLKSNIQTDWSDRSEDLIEVRMTRKLARRLGIMEFK